MYTGLPDWANMGPLADCLLCSDFLKMKGVAHIWVTFFHGKGWALILTLNAMGYIFGDFFTNSHSHPSGAGLPDFSWSKHSKLGKF
jgi:hypothetical protein